ncbi:MAG: ParB N-terminal domain-containing protein, partial [Alistipes sp.]|nr:ParB N-terminal domain-containing protein [Alistipes sp.]
MNNKQKGLGRGLNALFGDGAVEAAQKSRAQITEIEIGKIEPNALQPRQQFDEEALAELAESIRTLGLIQPITVRKDGD